MKDQYFGDVNNFRKYAFLRSLTASTGLRLGVISFLTEDDGRTDGRLLRYLDQPRRYRALDPELFDRLSRMKDGYRRSLRLVKQWRLLPRDAVFASERVSDDGHGRVGYWLNAIRDTAACPLLFLDPDNGLEVKSTPFAGKGSSKYVYWSELADNIYQGHSLIVYQHWRRETRDVQVAKVNAAIADKEWPSVTPFFHRTPHALFVS